MGKTDEQKASKMMCHLNDSYLEFYDENYAVDGKLSYAAGNFREVKQGMVGHFGKAVEPEDHISRAVHASIDTGDIMR